MKKINNKGYMLVEIIVASTIALVMAYFLIDVTVKFANKSNDYYIESILAIDKTIVTKEIMDDIVSKKLTKVECDDNTTKCTLTYDSDAITAKDLIIDKENNTISYGNYKKQLSEYISLGDITLQNDGNLLTISIPGYTNYSKEDYGINIVVPYSEDMEIVYPKFPDILINNVNLIKENSTGNYLINLNCNGANAIYDYSSKKIIVSNISVKQNAICSPEKISETRPTMADYIIDLLNGNNSVPSTSNNDGSILEKITENGEMDYRYRGTDPNNYIMFNDELWRIIGVFDENSHGIDNTNLVKIIRNDLIGSFVFDFDDSNDFVGSDIQKILNSAYYNHNDATNEDYCNNDKSVVKRICDFNRIGIQSSYKDMIEDEVNWFLGGNNNTIISNMYKQERNMYSIYRPNSNYLSTYDANSTIPIGLMYVSDFAYASSPKCDSLTHSTKECLFENWLNSIDFETTITNNHQSTNLVITICKACSGGINFHDYARGSNNIRPVLYLKSEVYFVSGNGTQTNPYIIGYK